VNAYLAGLQRGRIELRQKITNPWELVGEVWPWIFAVLVMYALADKPVPGTDFSLGLQGIPGILGVSVVYTGLLGLAGSLTTEQQDGTLLRMKAVPDGMVGYLVGRVLSRAGLTLVSVLVLLVPAWFLFDDLHLRVSLIWVLALGLVATLPLGAIIGFVVAPVVLRRMARRAPGVAVSTR
jgi:ABC-2 type transport system permease protein